MKIKRSPVVSPLVRSYQELMGVTAGFSEEELKKTYRRLVTLYHPDRNPDPQSQEQFLKVTEAYEALATPEKMERLNRSYLEKKLYDFPLEGLNISFGSFFGYREFVTKRVKRENRIGFERANETDVSPGDFNLSYSDTNHSILDSTAFDSIELIYAGKFSIADEERIFRGFKGSHLGQLPWVMLNNKGILHFLDGEIAEALKCYDELNARIPNNIIFLYRLALCNAILAFKNSRRNIFGSKKPEGRHLKVAVDSLRKAVAIGENRSVGKQICFTIRKTLADILEKAGKPKLAKQVWEGIRFIDPKSAEAQLKLKARL